MTAFREQEFRDACAWVDGMPDERWVPELRNFREPSPCGTLFCALGAMVEMGFVPHDEMQLTMDGQSFGMSAQESSNLFTVRGLSKYDHSALDGLSDRMLFRHRVCCFLRARGLPVSAEYARLR